MRGMYSLEEEKQRIIKIAILAVLIVAVVIIAATVGSSLAVSQVVEITSPEDLEKIGRQEGYPLDGEYVLKKDIDGGGKTIKARGTKDKPFAGHFDGQGHTIRNLTVEVEEVREIQTQEAVREVPGEERTESDRQPEAGEEGKAGSEDKNKTKKEEADVETAKQVKLPLSVDGYPLFEHTSQEKPGQIENLCVDGLKTVKVKENYSEGEQKAEEMQEKGQTGQPDITQAQKTETGREQDTIEIRTWEEFKNIGNTKYNPAYTMNASYVLVKDIKSDGKKFTPIGTEKTPFTGTFDGQGKKIDVSINPEIKTDTAYNGLFGVVKPADKEDNGNEK